MHRKPLESDDVRSLEEMLAVHRLLQAVPLERIESVLGHTPSPDRLEENMKKNGGRLRRGLKGRGLTKKPTKAEMKAKLRKQRERKAKYAREVAKPRRTAWTLQQIREEGAAGWWDLLRRKGAGSWSQKPYWRIGKEEFVEAVGNSLENTLPIVVRYDTKKLATLDNIYLVDSDTREVLFCGKEYTLKKLGYCL